MRTFPLLFVCLFSWAAAHAETDWLSTVDGWVPVSVPSGRLAILFRGEVSVGSHVICDVHFESGNDESDWVPLVTVVFSETGDLRRENSDESHLKLSALFDDRKVGREYRVSTVGMNKNIDAALSEVSDPRPFTQLAMFWSEQNAFLYSVQEHEAEPVMKKSLLEGFVPEHYIVAVSGFRGRMRCRTGT